MPVRSVPPRTAIAALCCAIALAALWPLSVSAAPLPPAGSDQLDVTGAVGVTSRLGSETFSLTGTATIDHGAPYMAGGVQVADLTLSDLNLTGNSLIGTIAITESTATASTGTLTGNMPPPESLPASAAFNVFIYAVAPANPSPTITLYNTTPLYMVPTENGSPVPVELWPPRKATFVADTMPCVPLLPTLPLDACITSLTVTLRLPGVGGMSELASAPRRDAARHEEAGITALEGVLVGVAAVTGVVVITGAGWYLRRWLADR